MTKTRKSIPRNVKISTAAFRRVRSHDNLAKAAGTKSKKVFKKRRNYALDVLNNAKMALANGKSPNVVSQEYGIPRQTCYDIKSKKYKSHNVGSSTYLDITVEKLLANAIVQLSLWGFGLNIIQVQNIVRDYLISSGTPNRFKNNTPGKKWFKLFRKRHANLTLRVAQNFPRNRAEALSSLVIDRFFKLVNDKYDELGLHDKPTHIFNADETGFSGDQGRQLIICQKG